MNRVWHFVGPRGQRLSLIAGITGLASDEQVVLDELRALRPDRILLGIPFEDLDAIRATSGTEDKAEFESQDLDDLYLDRLKKFGPVRSPPPDLYAAFRYAEDAGVPVQAIDLSDEAYTDAYTKNVGLFEVMRSSRQRRKMPGREFASDSADDFVQEWDDALNVSKGLRKVQRAREEAMTNAMQGEAPPATAALVPLPRASSILERLRAQGWKPTDLRER